MGQPTIEALRLALFDDTDGVLRSDYFIGNPNDLHDRTYIKSIEISQAKYVGRRAPLKVEFSPWMNSIIGGRGTGKSSIISFLRMTLNRQNELPEPIKIEFDDFARIPADRNDLGMLTNNTSIKTCIVKQGIEYNLLWENNKVYEIVGEGKSEAFDIQDRFPITMFSQKQLFEMTKDAQLLLNYIDKKWNSKEWSVGYNTTKNEFFNYLVRLNKNKTEIEEKTRLELSLQELEKKIEAFETDATKKILDQQKELLLAEQQARQIYGKYNKVLSDAKQLIADINEISDEAPLSDKIDDKSLAEINAWETTVKDFNKTFVELYEKSAAAFLPENDWFSKLDIATALKNNRSDIEKVIKELEKSGVDNIAVYPELLQQKETIEEQLKQYSNTTHEQEELQREREKLLNAFYALVKERIEQRNNVISQWNANSKLKITLLPFGNYDRNEDAFRGIINKSGTSFMQDILNTDAEGHYSGGLIFELAGSSDPEESIGNLKNLCATLLDSENNIYSTRFKNHISSLYASDNIFEGRLLTWIPEDQVKLELEVDNRKKISIDASSAGQRTSAMLALLLQNSEEPIIIDQPEDDLDTKIISDLIVSGINEKKKNQQIIIVTHNPNIVVNTNSEQVIHMEYNVGEIITPSSGALQNKSIRDAICVVMEGGKDALEKRYYRISKALE
jgi:biotin operon repressor